MKEKLTQMCTHSEMQTETAHVDDEAIKTTSGTGICLFQATSEQSLRFVNEMHGQEDLRKCSLEFMKKKGIENENQKRFVRGKGILVRSVSQVFKM